MSDQTPAESTDIADTSPSDPPEAAGPDGSEADAPESTKSAFEAAIERKRAAGQARSAHLDGGAKVGGATASHKTSRTFRRKSG